MSHMSNIIDNLSESDYPPELRDALVFQAAAEALVSAANDEKPVSLSTAITPKDVAKVVAAAVAFDLGHDLRIRHANTLARIAVERTGYAEQRAATLAEPWFAEQFNAAAKVLLDVIGKHGGVDPAAVEHGGWPFDPAWAGVRAALADVEKFSNLRDDFVFMSGGGSVVNPPVSNVYEKHSRCAILPDVNAAQLLEQASGKHGWHGAQYWLITAQTPGVRLAWQTSSQQHAQPVPALIARERAAMQATFEARATARRIA
jgi:hypothetical protein